MSFQNRSSVLVPNLLVAVGLLGAAISPISIAPVSTASASVLVDPRVRREVPSEVPGEVPATEIPAPSNASPSTPAQASGNIVDVARNTAGFRTLTSAITVANIGSVLSNEGPLTLFAPTDAAFAALPAGTLDSLLLPTNRDLLIKLLYNHVSYGDISSEQLISGQIDGQTGGQITTFDGTVDVAVMPTGVQIGEATVIQADVDASNGVIHAVDKVLLPTGFADQLQARIDGVEAPSQAQPQSPAAVNQPSTPATPIPSPNAAQTVPTASEASASEADSGNTADSTSTPQPVEPSTAAGEDAPVRALW